MESHLNPSIWKVDAGGYGLKAILDWISKINIGLHRTICDYSSIDIMYTYSPTYMSKNKDLHSAHTHVCTH